MTIPDETEEDERQADADFEAGAALGDAAEHAAVVVEPKKPEPKPDPKPDPKPEAPPTPKYVRLTEEQLAILDAAAKKTVSLEQQLSKAHGHIGDMRKTLNGLGKAEIPEGAFADLERDFPELAKQIRGALEATLKGAPKEVKDEVSDAAAARMVAEYRKLEVESLEDAYPDWRAIVGYVDIEKQQPDGNNPFRKWLTSKPAAYQAKITSTFSARVLERAIASFQTETKAAQAPKTPPTPDPRTQRIKDAVRPRGDGGQPTRQTEDDDFEAGYAGR